MPKVQFVGSEKVALHDLSRSFVNTAIEDALWCSVFYFIPERGDYDSRGRVTAAVDSVLLEYFEFRITLGSLTWERQKTI